MFTCPVPATSVEREEMKTSLRGSAETPRGTMVSSGSSGHASELGYGGCAMLGRGSDRDPDRTSSKSGGDASQDGGRILENAQTVKRNPQVSQRPSSEPLPQIYPWMTKLHMSHGKVCLCIASFFSSPFKRLKRAIEMLSPLFTPRLHNTSFARYTFPLEFYRPNAGNNKNSRS